MIQAIYATLLAGIAGLALVSGSAATGDCCTQNKACCNPPSACCLKADKQECCAEGASCCDGPAKCSNVK